VTGPYAYVANPMQIGGTVALATFGVLTSSSTVIAAAVMAALFSDGLAAWSENNDLAAQFGDEWVEYRAHVHAWLPRWRPYVATTATVFVGTTCEPCSEIGRFLARRRPLGLTIAAAEESSGEMTRMTYRADGVGTETGLAAVGRSLEHVNFALAIGSWIVRLPLVRPLLQLVADAVGGGPRQLSLQPATRSDDGPELLADHFEGIERR
jgi:Phospholipid methyltransferase